MIIIIILLAVVLLLAGFAIYRLLTVRQQNNQLNVKRFERVHQLYNKLENGEQVTEQDVLPYAQNLLTREATFQLLRNHNKTDLFPAEYHTMSKAAETNLANWLEFPTELDTCPDEIQYIKRVSIDFDGQKNLMHYEVFKYRVYEPHWAAKEGWMLGVVGPYFEDSKPYDFPSATFSRINSTIDKITPEEEVKWVHENISMKR